MKIPLRSEHRHDDELHRQTRTYRRLLHAFGYPMRIQQLEERAIHCIVDCLLDSQTTVAIEVENKELTSRILNTGATLSQTPEWVFAGSQRHHLQHIPAGSREAPESGATLVMEIAAISPTNGGLAIRATGAGLNKPHTLYFSGLHQNVVIDHIAFRADHPRGVDLLLCADTQLVVLPRHLTLEII